MNTAILFGILIFSCVLKAGYFEWRKTEEHKVSEIESDKIGWAVDVTSDGSREVERKKHRMLHLLHGGAAIALGPETAAFK